PESKSDQGPGSLFPIGYRTVHWLSSEAAPVPDAASPPREVCRGLLGITVSGNVSCYRRRTLAGRCKDLRVASVALASSSSQICCSRCGSSQAANPVLQRTRSRPLAACRLAYSLPLIQSMADEVLSWTRPVPHS